MNLEKKVHSFNETTRILEENYKYLLPQLKKFIGKKIFLKSGDKSTKFKKGIEFLNDNPKPFKDNEYAKLHYINLNLIGKFIFLEVVCMYKKNDTSCYYEQKEEFIGNIDDEGILRNVKNENPELEKYTVEQVEEALRKIDKLKRELAGLEHEFKPFKDQLYY